MPGNAVIETTRLTKHFCHPFFTWVVRARALTDLAIRIEPGEVFGLLGPNGSGKSTALKLILGLIFPTAGSVSLFGRSPRDFTAKERLGYLPEESYLYRFLTAEETLDFYGRLFRLTRRERRRRIDTLLSLVGLQAERRRSVVEFSKGMQRRLVLAQALINNPELIILDEPTSGLDPIATAQIKNLIQELRAEGKTIVLSSHLLANVEDVCDRVTILYGGRQQVTGSVEELTRHAHLKQITAQVGDDTLTAVEALIHEREGRKTKIDVTVPTENLESFFLRTVKDAQEHNLTTSGANDTSVDDLGFLRQETAPKDGEGKAKTS